MSELDPTVKIEVFGCHNPGLSTTHPEYWVISGDGMGEQGVELRPKLTGAIDAPVKSLWLPGAYGQSFVDFRWERRDVIFTVEIFDPNGDDPEEWHTVDWTWRHAWDYVKETTVRFTSSDGPRVLKLRMTEEPKAYQTDSWEGKDPHLFAEGTVVMTTAAELPFYVGETIVYEYADSSTDSSYSFQIDVDCDVPVWPRWVLTDQARWTLPDYSWGSEEYGRGEADADRTLPMVFLPLGAGVVADSDPRVQTFIAADRSHIQGFMKGQDLLYPILPNDESPTRALQITVNDATDGWAFRLEVTKWYTRPWSRPVGNTGFLASTTEYGTAGTFTYEIPEGATHLDIVRIGAGGGGRGSLDLLNGGEGGDPGSWQGTTLIIGEDITGTTITGTVGAGGTGGNGPGGSNGGLGGDTTVACGTEWVGDAAVGGAGGDAHTNGDARSGDSPGNFMFNGVTYFGGAKQRSLGRTGNAPGGGGSGGRAGLGENGGLGGAGKVWIRAYAV